MDKGGRPTAWSIAVEEKAMEYINGGWETVGHSIPSVVGLCSYIDRSRSVVYVWAEDENRGFKDILSKLKEVQLLNLMNKGLTSEFNSTITKLILTKHGFSDKVDTDVTSGGKAVQNEWHIHPVTNDNGKD